MNSSNIHQGHTASVLVLCSKAQARYGLDMHIRFCQPTGTGTLCCAKLQTVCLAGESEKNPNNLNRLPNTRCP